jgi:hypothetical protein
LSVVFVGGICRWYLSVVFVGGICRWYLSVVFVTGICGADLVAEVTRSAALARFYVTL